jgi:hypothetical protein
MLRGRKLKHEVSRKALGIALDLFVQPLDLHTVQLGQL